MLRINKSKNVVVINYNTIISITIYFSTVYSIENFKLSLKGQSPDLNYHLKVYEYKIVTIYLNWNFIFTKNVY